MVETLESAISKEVVEELLKLRDDGNLYHRESQTLEFKESFNYAGLAEYFRDFAAFANNKGGWLIFGVKDRPKRELIGLNEKASNQLDKFDPEKISGYLLDLFSSNITWIHDVIAIDGNKYGVFYIQEAQVKPVICKKDEGDLKNGEIYFRYGGRTQKIQYAELEAIINHRIERQNLEWIDLVSKIGKSGPQNAAILDMEKGAISKNDAQILVVDDKLIDGIKWIKEGSFDEKEGAPALKLVGEVQPIDTVEVIKKERTDKLKEYPLSASELAHEIKVKCDTIPQNEIWRIIQENGIKTNPDYSTYNFRNKHQQEQYEQSGKLPKGTPSIYKPTAIDFIIKIYKNEH